MDKLKNPESNMGRKEWDKTAPRLRMSINNPTAVIVLEAFDALFQKYPEKIYDPTYLEVQGYFEHAKKFTTTPLLVRVEPPTLF